MLENINDYLSFAAVFMMAALAVYLLFVVTDSHHDQLMKDRQERYYSFYETDENRSDPYYE